MPSRRVFLQGSLAWLAATAAASRLHAAARPDLSGLEGAAAKFHEYVLGRMMDADGLCRSMLNMETHQPWTEQQLTKLDPALLADMFQNSADKSGCLAYENALMATGEFAQSQMVRHRVTGEAAAGELAHRCVRAMLAVADEGRNYMPGFLPKPFGGLARARYSHELSPDQYTKTVAALHAWRPQADAKERAAIDRFFVEAADFFIARKFRHAFRHRTIVTADTHRHSLGLFVSIVVLAANVTGKANYRAHLKEFSRALDDSATDEKLANFNMTSLLIDGFDVAIKEGCDDRRLPALIGTLWAGASRNVEADGTSYEGETRRVATSQGCRIAACAPTVERYHPATPASAVAARILRRYRELPDMTIYRIPGAVSETSISSWLLAYWRLREKA